MSQKVTVTHSCDLCGAESEVAVDVARTRSVGDTRDGMGVGPSLR